MTGPLADVINPAKFYLNRVRGFDSVGGRIFGFPIRKRSRRATVQPVTILLRAIAECIARLSHCLGVRLSICPSVRLSVTLVICIKTVQAGITKFLLWAAPKILVFSDKILCTWVRGFPSNKGVKERFPLKRRYFATIGYIV